MDDQDFWNFLESISSEEIKNKMIDEKIGPDLVSLMTEDELSKYIPLHGERLRIRKYLRDQSNSKGSAKRSNLLKVLRDKIETRRGRGEDKDITEDSDMRSSNRRIGNRNAEKMKRRIELGWINKVGGKSTQVRSKKGGGTRKLMVSKDSTKQDLLQLGRNLFFPNGKSSHGSADKFDFDLCDYEENAMDENITVGAIYNSTKMSVLRFYLSSTERCVSQPEEDTHWESDSDSLPDIHAPKKQSHERISLDIVSEAIHIAGITDNEQEPMLTQPSIEVTENIDNGTGISGTEDQEHVLILHRGHFLKELIEAFATNKMLDSPSALIQLQVIMPNGEMEVAENAGGVTRDVITEFWSSFYTECTLGNIQKVPCLRHDFGEREWQAIAKIIVFGWKTVKYFPVHISPVFLQYCMYGKFEGDILDDFMQYIPKGDAETLKEALEDVSKVDKDELYDFFNQHELKRIPRQGNMERIIREMAHKELVQAVMFVIDCWSPFLKNLNITLTNLQSLYNNLIPTPKRVLNILKFPETMCQDSLTVSNHLKRFIKELDKDLLTKFMRFCTGTDLLSVDYLEISFVNLVGFDRRPVAHTCSPLLELPKQYENFLQFRTEFTHLLNSNIWVMDII